MNKTNLSDERLVSLHQQKRLNAFFILYSRYKNYGYAIIYRALEKYKLVNALKDERDAILFDSIMEAISRFSKEKGSFRQLLSTIITYRSGYYIREFRKDPISDYVSIDANYLESTNLRFMDSAALADKDASPRELIYVDDNAKKVENNYTGNRKRRVKKMIALRESGYTYREIAKQFAMSEKAVRAIFYRIKKRIDLRDNNKIKK